MLRPVEGAPEWTPWYDKAFGVIVRADTEEEARDMASECRGDEGKAVWLDESKTTCVELTPDGEKEIIMVDFAAA
jgi:hypothetical protein